MLFWQEVLCCLLPQKAGCFSQWHCICRSVMSVCLVGDDVNFNHLVKVVYARVSTEKSLFLQFYLISILWEDALCNVLLLCKLSSLVLTSIILSKCQQNFFATKKNFASSFIWWRMHECILIWIHEFLVHSNGYNPLLSSFTLMHKIWPLEPWVLFPVFYSLSTLYCLKKMFRAFQETLVSFHGC